MPAAERLLRTFATPSVTTGMHPTEIKRDAFARTGGRPYREWQQAWAGGPVADGLRRPPAARRSPFLIVERSCSATARSFQSWPSRSPPAGPLAAPPARLPALSHLPPLTSLRFPLDPLDPSDL